MNGSAVCAERRKGKQGQGRGRAVVEVAVFWWAAAAHHLDQQTTGTSKTAPTPPRTCDKTQNGPSCLLRRDQASELARQTKAGTEAQSEAALAAELSEIAAVEALAVEYQKGEGARRAQIAARTEGRDPTDEGTTKARDEAP